jgi:hypothetical protein
VIGVLFTIPMIVSFPLQMKKDLEAKTKRLPFP